MYIPQKISAGLTLDVNITLTAYPAPDWQLTLIMRGQQGIDIASTPQDAGHHIGASAETTASWPAGAYWYSLRASDGDTVTEIESGSLEVTADLASLPGDYDGSTHAQRCLMAIEAVLEKRATLDQERYRINNRELYRTSLPDLLMLRSRYRDEVRREKMACTTGQSLLGRQVKVRF